MNSTALKRSVVPAISQSRIKAIIALRRAIQATKARLESLESHLKDVEREIIDLLNQGAGSRVGNLSLTVNEVHRRYPRWKEEFISRLGIEEANSVTDATPATVYRLLLIKMDKVG